MNHKLIFFILFGAGALFAACSRADNTENDAAVRQVNVEVESVSPSSFESFIRVLGLVENATDVRISAEISGRIVSYSVKEGARVKKGQVIAKIDDSRLLQERNRLQAAAKQAEENYLRLKQLYEEEKIGSEINYLNAKYAYEQTAAQLETVEVDLKNTEIKAPFDAIVEKVLVEAGEMVSMGTPVVRIIGAEQVKITAGVPARYSNAVNVGDPVWFWFDTQTSDTLRSFVSFVGKSINEDNRTFTIEVSLPFDTDGLKVNMIANLRLRTLSRDNVVMVREEFVFRKNNTDVVYLLAQDSTGNSIAEERNVILGPSYKAEVIIDSGLDVGEKLITVGSSFLKNGMRINVIPADEQMATND